MKKTEFYKLYQTVRRELGCIVCRNQGRFSYTDTSVVTNRALTHSSVEGIFSRIPLCAIHYRDGGFGISIYPTNRKQVAGAYDRYIAVFESKFGALADLLKQVKALVEVDPRIVGAGVFGHATEPSVIPLEFAEYAVPTVPDYQPLEGSPAVQTAVVEEPLFTFAAPLQGQLLEAHEPDELPGQTPMGLLMVQAEEAKAELDLIMDEYLRDRTPKNEDRLRDQRLAYLACCRQVTELLMGGDAPLG